MILHNMDIGILIPVALICLIVLGSGRLARALYRLGSILVIVFFAVLGVFLWRSGDWAAALIVAALAALGIVARLGRTPENIEDNAMLVNLGVLALLVMVAALLVALVVGPEPIVGLIKALRNAP